MPASQVPLNQLPSNQQQMQYLQVPGQQVGAQGMPISPNNYGVPSPNYTYSHIGPNNQSLLSASTLHNKLRVIEQIHESPQEEDESEGPMSQLQPP